MRKQVLVAAVVVGVLALMGSSAYAQASLSTVKVPFQFVVGDTVLPAGSYVVTTIGEGSSILSVRSVDGKSTASVIVNLAEPAPLDANAVFSFSKIRGECFLSHVHVPGVSAKVIPLPSDRVEAVLAKMNGTKPARRGRPTV